MLHAELPLEMLASVASHPFQLGFARQALRMLPVAAHVSFEATSRGLLICASSEEALSEPTGLLRKTYGTDLVLSPPRVRQVFLGEQPYEPIMELSVSSSPRHRNALREDLVRRRAVLLGEEEHPDRYVVRAEAPLRRLLGYGDALAKLTDGTAQHRIWLSRYVPIDAPPGGDAA
jgi:predicted membrane GTPase involved in stress response